MLRSPRRAGPGRSPTALQAIDVQPLAGQQLQLTLKLSGPAPQPTAFTIDNPARISLDLPGHHAGADLTAHRRALRGPRHHPGRGDHGSHPPGAEPRQDDAVRHAQSTATTSWSRWAPATGAGRRRRRGRRQQRGAGRRQRRRGARTARIDFRRSVDGAGRVVVHLTDPHTHINLRQVGNQIVVDFATPPSPNLARRYDATDYGTPVTGFDVTRAGNGARIVISANGDYEQLAYQTDDQYVVEIPPQRKNAAAQEEKPVYTGEQMTLNFQDIETRAVLQLLADASGQNIVVSDSVSGNVTLRLQNVPWDQALDIVLRTKGLDKRQQDNVIIVAPQAELAAREKAELAAKRDVQELAPLRSEYLQVNYAKAADMATLIKTSGSSLLSPRGSVSVDDRTNTLLLQDTADRLADIRRLVATLDIPVRQVQIEARIVIVNNDFTRDLGARLASPRRRRTAPTASSPPPARRPAARHDRVLGPDQPAEHRLDRSRSPSPTAPPRRPATTSTCRSQVRPAALPWASSAPTTCWTWSCRRRRPRPRPNIISSPRVITANQKEATDRAGHGNSVPAVGLQRRDHHLSSRRRCCR